MSLSHPSPTRPSTDEAWRQWGERDPYFGVITDERFRRERIDDEAREAFFASGQRHVRHVLRECTREAGRGWAPRRVLDFGCGVGRVALAFAAQADEVVGIDIAPAMLEEASRQAQRLGLADRTQWLPSDDTLSFVQGEFDLVHSFIVFQHMEPRRGRAICARLLERLRPGGMGALHFTYAKAWLADRWGIQVDPWWTDPVPAPVPHKSRLQRLREWLVGRPPAADRSVAKATTTPTEQDPDMQMNAYLLNELCFALQRLGVRRLRMEFTDHGGELGAVLYFQRPAS